VDRSRFRLAEAPDAVRDSLEQMRISEAREELFVRTVYTDALNSGRAEPDRWDEDFEISMENARTAHRGMRNAEWVVDGLVERSRRIVDVRTSRRQAGLGIKEAVARSRRETLRAYNGRRRDLVVWLVIGLGVISLVAGGVWLWNNPSVPVEYRD
jgi:hypothetical protein